MLVHEPRDVVYAVVHDDIHAVGRAVLRHLCLRDFLVGVHREDEEGGQRCGAADKGGREIGGRRA